MISSSSPTPRDPVFKTPVLEVNGESFEIRFLAQADDDHKAHDAETSGSPEDHHTGEAAHDEGHEDHAAHDDHGDSHAADDGHGAHSDDDHADAHGEHGDSHSSGHGDGHDAGHGGGHGKEKYEVPDELPNIYTLGVAAQQHFFPSEDAHHGDHHEGGHHGPWFLNPAFSMFYALLLIGVLAVGLRKLSVDRPGKFQVAVEGLFSGLANFFGEIVGPENIRKYVPFIGSLWLFILLNNWFALIPFFKSPTAYIKTTAGLGFCVFIFVNYHGIKAGGLGHYLWHLCGSPANAVGWIMAPLMFVLELVGTFVKPVSLSLRLYGNIFGEDKLLAIFLGLGMSISAVIMNNPSPLIGIPLHLPFLFLSVLLGTIQATVFAMLAAVYIALLLPHHDHEHEHDEAHAAHGEEAHPEHA